MDFDEAKAKLERLKNPPDWDSLIAAGAMERVGRRYRVLNRDLMPKHWEEHFLDVKEDKSGVTFGGLRRVKR